MSKFSGSIQKYPARSAFLWYAGLIIAGTAALMQPACRGADAARPISLTDALFTTTSACCVTGLSVRSTGHDFSWLGQAVILVLIQLGGIGILTVTTLVTVRLGRVGLRDRMVLSETLGNRSENDVSWVISSVLRATFLLEGAGFVLLFGRNLFDQKLLDAAWHALFHSISAFCNAGFGLYDDSLVRYQGDVVVNLTVIALVVLGGIGFPVLIDVRSRPELPWRDRMRRWQLHTKMMLIGTVVLLTAGTVAFLAFEWNHALADVPLWKRLLIGLFQSAMPRTAGFNSVDIGGLTTATLFIIMILMTIGAGPCSTAGGFKVSTLMVLLLHGWSKLHGRNRVNVFRRSIPRETVDRAIAALISYSLVAAIGLTLLVVTEHQRPLHGASQGVFLDAAFETISALSTVGLTTGLTSVLSEAGRIIVCVLMFVGRLGPISLFIVISRAEREDRIGYAEEELIVG
jgi:trk system potassium uptake protein TrkH